MRHEPIVLAVLSSGEGDGMHRLAFRGSSIIISQAGVNSDCRHRQESVIEEGRRVGKEGD